MAEARKLHLKKIKYKPRDFMLTKLKAKSYQQKRLEYLLDYLVAGQYHHYHHQKDLGQSHSKTGSSTLVVLPPP